jgi:hypothetical protein
MRDHLWWAHNNGIVPLSRRLIAKINLPLHLAGHAFPALMFVLALTSPDIARVCLGAGGIAALAGGACWKFMLIVRGGYQQGFSLPMLPQRGSGTRAAPGRGLIHQAHADRRKEARFAGQHTT